MATYAVALGVVTNLAGGIAGAAVAGVGLGGVKVCREMILANLVDRSRERCGHRCEGVYYGLNRFIGRLSRLLEAGALALIGVLFGYVSADKQHPGENPGPDPANAADRVRPTGFCSASFLVCVWRWGRTEYVRGCWPGVWIWRAALRGQSTSDRMGNKTS